MSDRATGGPLAHAPAANASRALGDSVVRYDRSAAPAPLPPASLAGRRILFLLAPAGHAVQEVVVPAAELAAAGATVVYATLGARRIVFDPTCHLLAVLEAAWSPTLRLFLAERRAGRLHDVANVATLEAQGELDAFLADFDAVVVPGGHGAVFGAFLRDPLLHRVLMAFRERGAVVGLVCHAVAAGAYARDAGGRTLIAGRQVTCWPRSLERLFAATPFLGRYFRPCGAWVEEVVVSGGAETHSAGAPWRLPTAMVDGAVVTTWGPWTGTPFARALGHRLRVGAVPMLERRVASPVRRDAVFRNWGRNFACRPLRWYAPTTVEQVAEIIREAAADGRAVRPVGSGYSYTRLVQTEEVLVTLDGLAGIEWIDRERGIAKVRAGTKLYDLCGQLAARGLALATGGDIDRQTVAGAISTGTHGTGLGCGCLSTLVRGLTFVDGRGEVVEVEPRRDPEAFRFARVGLGSFGVLTHVELAVEPLYHLAVHRWGSTIERTLDGLDELLASNRNFEFFWYPGTPTLSAKRMNLAPAAPATLADRVGRFVNEIAVENGLAWMAAEAVRMAPAIRRPLERIAERLVVEETTVRPAHRAYATPRLVRHQEVEYALPIERAREAILELDAFFHRFPMRTVFPVEVRFVKGDDIPLSPAHRQDSVWIAAHTYLKEDHREYFDRCEAIFRGYGGRPHWGKLHSLRADDFATLYPEWDEFHVQRRRFDADGRFRNAYLERIFGPGAWR